VKRRIFEKKPITGELLEFALGTLPKPEVQRPGKDDFYDLLDGVRQKFIAGQPLTDYEAHIYVDMVLLHERIYG
jgi:hypothetical protein